MKTLIKITLIAMMGFGTIGNANSTEENLGFLMNQKYVCINQGALIGDKMVPILSREDSLKYPVRIVVDDNNRLQTDGAIKNLQNIDKLTYGNTQEKVMLVMNEDKHYMIMSSKKMQNMPIIYACTETNNWTLGK